MVVGVGVGLGVGDGVGVGVGRRAGWAWGVGVGVGVGDGLGVGVGLGDGVGLGVGDGRRARRRRRASASASGSASGSGSASATGSGSASAWASAAAGSAPSNGAWWISPHPVWLKLAAITLPSTFERVCSDTAARGARIVPSTVALLGSSVNVVAFGRAIRMRLACVMPMPEKFGASQVPVVQSGTAITSVASLGIERKVIVPSLRNCAAVGRHTFSPEVRRRYGLTVLALQFSPPPLAFGRRDRRGERAVGVRLGAQRR